MRNIAIGFVVISCLACSSQTPTENETRLRLAPATLSITATSRQVPNARGGEDLEVSALLRNATKSHIVLVNGSQCRLFVRLFPDPTGEEAGALDPSMGCKSGGPTLDLAPGATATLTRVFSADTLASFAAGQYGINVVVTTTTDLSGVWGGTVVLPLPASQ